VATGTATEFLHASDRVKCLISLRTTANELQCDLGSAVSTSNPDVVDWVRFAARHLYRGCSDPLVFAFIVLWFIYLS
jgi:hypothetical protein